MPSSVSPVLMRWIGSTTCRSPGQAHPQRQANMGACDGGPAKNLPATQPRCHRRLGEHRLRRRCGRRTAANRRNFQPDASLRPPKPVDPDTRLPAPRYWFAAPVSRSDPARWRVMWLRRGPAERIYGWPASAHRRRCQVVDLHHRLRWRKHPRRTRRALRGRLDCGLVVSALRQAARCSSDPVCAMRLR